MPLSTDTVYITHSSEYFLVGDECVAVRDRATGQWLEKHDLVGHRVSCMVAPIGGAMRRHVLSPRVGSALFFEALHVVTEPVRVVRTAKPEEIDAYRRGAERDEPDRRFAYAVSSWVATLDGELSEVRREGLRTLATHLKLGPADVAQLEIVVRRVTYASGSDDPAAFDLATLRRELRAAVEPRRSVEEDALGAAADDTEGRSARWTSS